MDYLHNDLQFNYAGSSNSRYVEILEEDGSQCCSLPDLPDIRRMHTQSGLTACGGYGSINGDASRTCVTFDTSSGQWSTSHTLQHSRYKHSSWMSSKGVVLMGGDGGIEGSGSSGTTSELLNSNGRSTPSFSLKYHTA